MFADSLSKPILSCVVIAENQLLAKYIEQINKTMRRSDRLIAVKAFSNIAMTRMLDASLQSLMSMAMASASSK